MINDFKILVAVFAWLFVLISLGSNTYAQAQKQTDKEKYSPVAVSKYLVGPGDVLEISVWKEPDLEKRLVVVPDGVISFPLAGNIQAEGKTIDEIKDLITNRLATVLVEPVVNVSLIDFQSQKIYVIGKVRSPGAYQTNGVVDVMQALSLAGGMATFADQDSIKILRRENSGSVAIPFDYSDVVKGESLEQNILLKKGDVVVVP